MKLRAIWFTGLTALALFAGLGLYLAPLKPSLLALQFAFSPDSFRSILTTWGGDGVALYRSHLPVDGFLLLSYGAFGYLLTGGTRLFAHYRAKTRGLIALLMPLAAVADAGENLLHWWLTAPDADFPAAAVALAGVCSSLKWLGIVGFGVSVAVALVARRRL